MEFDEIISKRRSARSFKKLDVTALQINKILQSASTAPSAKNRQPWKFYILNEAQKKHVMDMLIEWEKQNSGKRTSVKGTAEQIKQANKMIMIYSDDYKSKIKRTYYKKPDYISIGCAIENMSLEAVNLGLGSCILCDTLYIENEINGYLGIKNHELICGFILGIPIYDYPPKIKKSLNALLLNNIQNR